MERLKNMELKKTFLVLSASCVLVALLMLGLVFMICNSISSNFPSGGIEILADGSIVKMETPTETQQNILSMLGIIQIVSCIVLPMGGLALSGILYYLLPCRALQGCLMPAVPFRTCISATMQLQMKPLASHQKP